MPVVKGERIGESRKLNRCSVAAHVAYAAFVAAVPDNFGRFRASPSSIAERMFPRREDDRWLIVRSIRSWLKEWHVFGLVRLWDCDDVTFGEVTNWTATGNTHHRTPEPPWSTHEHVGFCCNAGLARAREWPAPGVEKDTRKDSKKDRSHVDGISHHHLGMSEDHLGTSQNEVDGSATYTDEGGDDRPLARAPSVPSVVVRNTPPLPPSPTRGGNGLPKRLTERQVRQGVERFRAWWVAIGGHPNKDNRRKLRDSVLQGKPDDVIAQAIVDYVHDEKVYRGEPLPDPWPPTIPLPPEDA